MIGFELLLKKCLQADGEGLYMKRSDFFNEVYKIVSRIPKGNVMTYGQIAVLLNAPNCARQVGQAMYNTPEYLDIPSHRVVNSKGGLAPPSAFGGEGVQRRRLEVEGVLFTESGCVDLKRSIFRDTGDEGRQAKGSGRETIAPD